MIAGRVVLGSQRNHSCWSAGSIVPGVGSTSRASSSIARGSSGVSCIYERRDVGLVTGIIHLVAAMRRNGGVPDWIPKTHRNEIFRATMHHSSWRHHSLGCIRKRNRLTRFHIENHVTWYKIVLKLMVSLALLVQQGIDLATRFHALLYFGTPCWLVLDNYEKERGEILELQSVLPRSIIIEGKLYFWKRIQVANEKWQHETPKCSSLWEHMSQFQIIWETLLTKSFL